MSTRYHGPFRWMGNFKAVAIDYEYYLTLSDEPRSVCLTERQMYVLSVQNTYTAWLTRWYNTDDITQKTVQFIAAEIESLLMCGCGIPQPTITDRLNTITYNNSTTTIYENTENTWNAGGQTVISIAPNLDWDTGDPIDIAKLTCAAIRNLLNAIAAQGKQMNQMTADQNKDLVNGISSALGGLSAASGAAAVLAGLGVGVVGFFASPWLTFGLALGAVGTKIGSLFVEAPPTLFDDTEAIEKLVCVMVNNTNDDTMTREKFQGALTPNDFAPGSPEAQLAEMVQPYLDDLTVYLQFMSLGNQLYEVTDFATLPECGCEGPCDDGDDFTTGTHGWTSANGSSTYTEYHTGEGWGRGSAVPNRIGIRIPQDGTVSKITLRWNQETNGQLDLSTFNYTTKLFSQIDNTGTEWTIDTPGYTGGILIDTYPQFAGTDWPPELRLMCVTLE